MRVALAPADNGGCGHYRMRLPASVLADQVEIEIIEQLQLKQDALGRIVDVMPLEADVLVLQRPMHHWASQAIPLFQRKGVRVVVELDDDLASLHPRNGAFALCHPKTSPQMNWQHLKRACALADLVTVSTPALAERYGAHGRVLVLENCVPEAWTEIPRVADGMTIGWAGVVGVHPDDLQVTHGGVQQALEATHSRFLCVGNGELVREHLRLHADPDVTGWVEMEEYPHQLARFDVGIVPLADSVFNAAKSWLKGLEYAALGVPFVASEVSEYLSLADYGIGRLARDRARDWKREITRLMTDRTLREELSEYGREQVREHLTIEKNAWRWAEAWEEACA